MSPRYRQLLPVPQALRMLQEAFPRPARSASAKGEEVDCESAVGRITAEPVRARVSSPAFPASAMDGIALAATVTRGATPLRPLRLAEGVQAFPIDTGDPLPTGCDAVIPIELVQQPTPGCFEISAAAIARQHVRLTGEDLTAGEIILASARPISPVHLGAFLSTGVTRVRVVPRPRVAVLPTGDELCEPDQDPRAGRVIESNSRMLCAMLRDWGAETTRLPPQPDQPERLTTSLREACASHDLVLVLAGSSAGRGDFTPQAIAQCGQLLFHGLALMPGKPTVAGKVAEVPVIGVPGYPISALMAVEALVRPLLALWLGQVVPIPAVQSATLLRALVSRSGLEEKVRVLVGQVAGRWVAAPLARGAGALSSLTRAHGLITIAPEQEGLAAGSRVEVELYRPARELEDGLLLSGSNDLALALLDDALGRRNPRFSLGISPLGSEGGLLALARGEAHLAGCHLLDPLTNEYNQRAVRELVPRRKLWLVCLAHRAQGLCFRPNTPVHPGSFRELIAAGLSFVNRQAGSGTRLLTDTCLQREGLSLDQIPGTSHEELTHMAVAEAVAAGFADCGMLIRAAAEAAGLDFVPLTEERYDLVVPQELWTDKRIEALLKVLGEFEFRRAVEALGGYSTRESGRVTALET